MGETELTKGGNKITKAIKRWRWLWIGVLILVFFVLPFSLYFFSPARKIADSFLKRLPYPVAIIFPWRIVSSKDLLVSLDSVKKYYQSPDFAKINLRVDFSTPEGQKRLKIKEKDILDKLIEDQIIQKICHEQGIKVTDGEIQEKLLSVLKNVDDSKVFIDNLRKTYGWGVAEYKNNVIKNQLYLEKLIQSYLKDNEETKAAFQRASKALAELKSDNSNFSEVAAKYSEGESASSGGKLGWMKREFLVKEVDEAIGELKAGERTGIVESSLGYHIVLLEERRLVENAGEKSEEVKISQIFIRSNSFVSWLQEQKSKQKVWIITKEYFWDQKEARVRFSDPEMDQKEFFYRIKADGDPSV